MRRTSNEQLEKAKRSSRAQQLHKDAEQLTEQVVPPGESQPRERGVAHASPSSWPLRDAPRCAEQHDTLTMRGSQKFPRPSELK